MADIIEVGFKRSWTECLQLGTIAIIVGRESIKQPNVRAPLFIAGRVGEEQSGGFHYRCAAPFGPQVR